jgi:hypothetical protein
MNRPRHQARQAEVKNRGPARRVRLPGFVDDEIGLGDMAKLATRTLGITPCRGCEDRARRMNQWMTFSGGRGGTT